MDALLASHRIPVAALRADDFDSFCDQRQQNLLALIEAAMESVLQRWRLTDSHRLELRRQLLQ